MKQTKHAPNYVFLHVEHVHRPGAYKKKKTNQEEEINGDTLLYLYD